MKPPNEGVLESLLLLDEASLAEFVKEEGFDLVAAGGELAPSSELAGNSLDVPSSFLLSDIEVSPLSTSSWPLLYAAEPMPRSGVCRNHEGSLEPNDWAIWVLEGSDSSAVGSGVSSERVAGVRR